MHSACMHIPMRSIRVTSTPWTLVKAGGFRLRVRKQVLNVCFREIYVNVLNNDRVHCNICAFNVNLKRSISWTLHARLDNTLDVSLCCDLHCRRFVAPLLLTRLVNAQWTSYLRIYLSIYRAWEDWQVCRRQPLRASGPGHIAPCALPKSCCAREPNVLTPRPQLQHE